jgi:hypothetical protein
MMSRQAILTILLACATAPGLTAEQNATVATPGDHDDPLGRELSERLGPYIQTVPVFSQKHDKRRVWKQKYGRLTTDEKVCYCIFQLRNESWWERDGIWSDAPYSEEPEGTPRRELIKLGRSAVPQLLRALDSRVPTKIHPSRHVDRAWLVQDAALDTIENIACRFFAGGTQVPKLSDIAEQERQEVRKKVTDWWEQNKSSDEIRWAKDVLLAEKGARYGNRGLAIDSLYRRLGKESYPFLVKAYHHLPKGRDDADAFDATRSAKVQILQWLLKSPTGSEKSVFASAVQDAPLWVRISGAEGLWAIGDPSGLEAMVQETEGRLLTGSGSAWLTCEYDNLMSFLRRCNTPESREAIYKCLRGRNPYLRERAIRSVRWLRMEKAVRALPELFDDPFVLTGSYTQYVGETQTLVLPRRVCDEAAQAFTEVVPDAPRFVGSTAEEKKDSIEKLKQWWKENGKTLQWNEKHGTLVRPGKKR